MCLFLEAVTNAMVAVAVVRCSPLQGSQRHPSFLIPNETVYPLISSSLNWQMEEPPPSSEPACRFISPTTVGHLLQHLIHFTLLSIQAVNLMSLPFIAHFILHPNR